MTRTRLCWHLLPVALLVLLVPRPIAADLYEYARKPDEAFAWKLKEKKESADGTLYELHLVSQVWHGITWEHQLQIFLPKNVQPTATMYLWNQGGTSNAARVLFGFDLAMKMKAPVAMLYGVPNQPLLDDKREDTLIAETFVRYLKSGDSSWPLLFPMVKSLTRAMDAIQAFARQEWKTEVGHFVVAGASKRGWTTWLTGAADPRVKAMVPCVIDTLKMVDQMDYQLKSYGAYSPMIADYTKRELVPIPNTPEARKLWAMVDPWVHRDKLKQPKFIINGTNDPYWTQDALNLYWDDLPGDKWVLYVPNAGHNLQQKHEKANPIPDLTRAINTQAAFARHIIHGIPMPKVTWKHTGEDAKPSLQVEADTVPKAARIWSARAMTRDFREARWSESQVTVNGKAFKAEMEKPAEGCLAYFAELEYEIDGLRYYVSTQLRIVGTAKK